MLLSTYIHEHEVRNWLRLCQWSSRRSADPTCPDRGRIAGMMKVLAKLKLFLYAWLRQPKDEMNRRQDKSEIQPLFPPKR